MRRRVCAAAFVVFLLVQVAVPAAALLGPRPAKYGWQMFSGAPQALGYAVVLADGSVEDVDLDQHLVNVRGDAPLETVVPARLCAITPGADAVVVRRLLEEAQEVPCA